MRAERRSRRMFFETLEPRQMLTVVPVEGTPFWDFPGNYLPTQSYHSGSGTDFLSGPAAGDPLMVALNYLQQNAAAYGLTPNDLTHLNITSQYVSPDLGVTHIYLEQTFNELPVADANININVMTDGRILTAGANFVRGISQLQQDIDPQVSAQEAVILFANAIGIMPSSVLVVSPPSGLNQHTVISSPNVSLDPIDVELHYVPSPGGGVDLAWEVIARPPGMTNWFDVSIAASGFRAGSVIRVADWTANASYNVFPTTVQDPAFGSRSIVVDPWNTTASPFGWHDGNGTLAPDFTDTRGNNVFAQEDADGFVLSGLPGGFRPQGGAALNFNFPIDFQQNPQTYQSAAITNLFYWVNIAHDVSFNHGFTEPAGNFQFKNYTNTGLANDPVMANNQELFNFGFANNAFMGTPPDGQRPSMGMFLFDLSITTFETLIPLRDGSLDGTIILHEFTHGTSNRLTGGPANANALQALQSGGMGEGWSDWFAMTVTSKANHTKNTPRGTGQWVSKEDSFGEGIRRFPYSFDMSIDPLTLNDFNGDSFPQQNNSEVHNAGEIWCTVLWDLTRILIDKYGFSSNLNNHTGGQNVAMDLVLGGMKLQPTNPSFIEARDAIFAADQALTGGQNFVELWTAFARRGFGFSASSGLNSNSVEVSATFDLPPLPVGGTVFEDFDGDGVHDANEGPLAGWTVFNDADNDRSLDPGEPTAVTGANGTYSVLVPAGVTAHIREVVMPGWRQTAPSSGVFNINVALGQSLTNFNFLNQNLNAGGIRGTKFNDLDGNGARDPGEPGIQGVIIYVDLNKDGRIGILEPSATTDASGNYFIQNVRVGTYQVREATKPGLIQTFPDPADPATLGGAHIAVAVVSGVTTTGINFGNQIALDFGDAPASYGTTLAANGPRHGMVAGFGLTLTPGTATGVIDAEPNGLPHPSALGDDLNGVDDENGVSFPAGLVPGSLGEVVVGARTTGFSPAFLHAWVDFNRNGVFDASEKLVFTQIDGQAANTNEPQIKHGVHTLRFNVPANASLGATFARFRFAFERGLGPLGAASAGEVEDLVANLLQDQAIAVNDIFPDRTRVPPDEFIKLNSDFTDPGNSLDVLRNDFGTSTDPTPEIVAANFSGPGQTLTTTAGGTIKFISPTAPLQYKPAPGFTGLDSFQYQVTAGGSTSAFATVTINVSPSDPVAVDDLVFFTPGSGTLELPPLPLGVRDNDLAAANQPIFIVGQPIPLSASIPTGLTLTTNATNTNLVLTRQVGTAAATFQGTVRFTYTIDDVGDPSTAPSTAVVTIEITPSATTPAASHLAIFKTRYLNADAAGNPLGPTSVIDLDNSDFFWVEMVVQDVRGLSSQDSGVESAYVDMIIKEITKDNPLLPLVAPVLNAAQTSFVIQFEPSYQLNQRTDATFSVPSTVQEIGAARGSVIPPVPPNTGNGEVTVMRVKFRAFGGGSVVVQADHADSPQLPTAVFDANAVPIPGPLAVSDDQVFIHKAGTLQILPVGSPEGEFTNQINAYDVNADGDVNQIDILMLVNDLSLFGPRPLNQLLIALDGLLPAGYLDVNIDALVNIVDILSVVNYLTAAGASGQSAGGGAGEGEAEGEGAGVTAATFAAGSLAASQAEPDVGDPLGTMVNFLAWEQSQVEPTLASGEESDAALTSLSSSRVEEESTGSTVVSAATDESTTTSTDSDSEAVDLLAADELYASLTAVGNQFKRLRLARS